MRKVELWGYTIYEDGRIIGLHGKEIKELYSKKKKVRMETNKKLEKNDPMTNVSYRKLAELYGVSHSMIAGIVKGQFRNKENYILK